MYATQFELDSDFTQQYDLQAVHFETRYARVSCLLTNFDVKGVVVPNYRCVASQRGATLQAISTLGTTYAVIDGTAYEGYPIGLSDAEEGLRAQIALQTDKQIISGFATLQRQYPDLTTIIPRSSDPITLELELEIELRSWLRYEKTLHLESSIENRSLVTLNVDRPIMLTSYATLHDTLERKSSQTLSSTEIHIENKRLLTRLDPMSQMHPIRITQLQTREHLPSVMVYAYVDGIEQMSGRAIEPQLIEFDQNIDLELSINWLNDLEAILVSNRVMTELELVNFEGELYLNDQQLTKPYQIPAGNHRLRLEVE